MKISRLDKLLIKIWPRLEMRRMAKKLEIKNVIFDKLHEIFSQAESIDIFPYTGNQRGFILVLNRQTALFFDQDGDHFQYDGFEMGEYNKGEVTIFDCLNKDRLSPYPEIKED